MFPQWIKSAHVDKKTTKYLSRVSDGRFLFIWAKNRALSSMCQVYNKCYFNESNVIDSTSVESASLLEKVLLNIRQ